MANGPIGSKQKMLFESFNRGSTIGADAYKNALANALRKRQLDIQQGTLDLNKQKFAEDIRPVANTPEIYETLKQRLGGDKFVPMSTQMFQDTSRGVSDSVTNALNIGQPGFVQPETQEQAEAGFRAASNRTVTDALDPKMVDRLKEFAPLSGQLKSEGGAALSPFVAEVTARTLKTLGGSATDPQTGKPKTIKQMTNEIMALGDEGLKLLKSNLGPLGSRAGRIQDLQKFITTQGIKTTEASFGIADDIRDDFRKEYGEAEDRSKGLSGIVDFIVNNDPIGAQKYAPFITANFLQGSKITDQDVKLSGGENIKSLAEQWNQMVSNFLEEGLTASNQSQVLRNLRIMQNAQARSINRGQEEAVELYQKRMKKRTGKEPSKAEAMLELRFEPIPLMDDAQLYARMRQGRIQQKRPIAPAGGLETFGRSIVGGTPVGEFLGIESNEQARENQFKAEQNFLNSARSVLDKAKEAGADRSQIRRMKEKIRKDFKNKFKQPLPEGFLGQ